MSDDDAAFRQRQWIETGYVWLDEHWADESLLWRDVRVAFLAFMGVTDEDLAGNVDCRALGAIVEYVDGLPDHDMQRAALLTPDDRDTLRENAILDWERASAAQPAAAAPAATFDAPAAAEPGAAAPGEAQWVDGYGWMRLDPTINDWVAAEAPPGAQAPAAPPAPEAAAAPEAAPAAPAAPEAAAAPEAPPAAPPAPEAPAAPDAPPAAPPAPDVAAAAASGETPPAAPPAPDAPLADAIVVGGTDPQLAAAVADLPPESAELFTAAVTEELTPVIEEIMASTEGLEGLSDEDIQAAFAAAVAEAGLAAEPS